MMLMPFTTTWKCDLAAFDALFLEYANEEGTSYLRSEQVCWLALFPKKILSELPSKPLTSFLFGFFSYEWEGKKTLPFQKCTLFEPQLVLRLDVQNKIVTQWGTIPIKKSSEISLRVQGSRIITRSDSYQSYCEKVEAVRQAIYSGDVYQVNLSQEFVFEGVQATEHLWLRLAKQLNPAYGAYLNCGWGQILSLSPELFVEQEKCFFRLCPIKGTAPACSDSKILLESKKERAELTMITDLYRNDCGRFALPGSIRVKTPIACQTLKDVHHLYSEITACSKRLLAPAEVLPQLFPAGSIAGCPKKSAMQWIEQLEAGWRGPYTGSIGWLGPDSMQLNVAIRTLVAFDRQLYLRLGGGIVADSSPLKEYQETLDKGRSFFQELIGKQPR